MKTKPKFSLDIANAFKDRKFKYSGTATLLVICVVIATLLVNLLFSIVPLKVDITANKIFSISDKTLSVLNRLEDNIKFNFIYQVGLEDTYVMELADRYDAASDKIETQIIDPVVNPGFKDMFAVDDNKSSTEPQTGSVVIENTTTGMFVTLTTDDFYSYSYDEEGNATQKYYDGEEAFTSAIAAVTTEMTYNVGVLTGHNENSVPEAMKTVMDRMFFNVYDVDLMTDKEIPAGTDVLLILAPEWDITAPEKDTILEYLDPKDTAGSVIFVAGKAKGDTPNLDELLEHYCVSLEDKIIYEENTKNTTADVKYSLMLPYERNDITGSTTVSQKLLFNEAKPIFTYPELSRVSTLYFDLALTSDQAWASDNPKSGTLEFDPDTDLKLDKNAAFVPALGVMELSDSVGTKVSNLIIFNCEYFLLEDQGSLNAYANDEVFYSALYWCIGDSNAKVNLTSKYFITATHELSTFGIYVYGVIFGIVIPVAILGCGLVVYLKRRHL